MLGAMDNLTPWKTSKGGVAKWLGTGLQIRERRFESGRHLQFTLTVEGLRY